MSKAVIDNSDTGKMAPAMFLPYASCDTNTEPWLEFDERSRQWAGLTPEATMKRLSGAANNPSDTALLRTYVHSMVAKGTERVEPSASLDQISKAFASKHRSKATRQAFRRMYAAVEDALKGLPRTLGSNLAGVILSGPLAAAQVGDGSVDLLVVLHELPDSPYELSKQLSGDVLYPIFKTYGVFPSLWCVSLAEWKKSQLSPFARSWPKKERGIPILGEETLAES